MTRDSAPYRLTERRQAILRQTSAALQGRLITLLRVAQGLAVAEAASRPNSPALDPGRARTSVGDRTQSIALEIGSP